MDANNRQEKKRFVMEQLIDGYLLDVECSPAETLSEDDYLLKKEMEVEAELRSLPMEDLQALFQKYERQNRQMQAEIEAAQARKKNIDPAQMQSVKALSDLLLEMERFLQEKEYLEKSQKQKTAPLPQENKNIVEPASKPILKLYPSEIAASVSSALESEESVFPQKKKLPEAEKKNTVKKPPVRMWPVAEKKKEPVVFTPTLTDEDNDVLLEPPEGHEEDVVIFAEPDAEKTVRVAAEILPEIEVIPQIEVISPKKPVATAPSVRASQPEKPPKKKAMAPASHKEKGKGLPKEKEEENPTIEILPRQAPAAKKNPKPQVIQPQEPDPVDYSDIPLEMRIDNMIAAYLANRPQVDWKERDREEEMLRKKFYEEEMEKRAVKERLESKKRRATFFTYWGKGLPSQDKKKKRR